MASQIDMNAHPARGRWRLYHAQLDVMDARDKLSHPLSADEMLVQIPRDQYRTLLELACEALHARYDEFDLGLG